MLRDFRLVESRLGPGQDANAVLEDVFGQPARTVQVQQALDAVRDSIDDQDCAAAGAALEALTELRARTEPESYQPLVERWLERQLRKR